MMQGGSSWTWTAIGASILLAGGAPAIAQPAAPDPAGDWQATVQAPAGAVRVAVHIRRTGSAFSATLDHPDQGLMGVPLADVTATGGRLAFDLPEAKLHYAGVWDAGRSAYVGEAVTPQGKVAVELRRGTLPPPKPAHWNAPLAPGFTWTPGPAARARVGPTLPLGKCINMSDMLESPTEGAWGPGVAEDDFRIIRAAGFTSVRIPVGWSYHAAKTAPYAIDPAFLARVHHVVDLATASGLNVMLNVHNYDELMSDPEGQRDRFAGLWRQIAASFATAPSSVWFELLNEPHEKLTDANLRSVLDPALKAVRETNPTRIVVWGGQMWSGLASLQTVSLPADPYVVPTFHYYDPFPFTHQGASWVPNAPPMGRAYGSAKDKALLDRDIAAVKAWMAKTGRVPVMGEFGAQDDPRVPLEQRLRYYRAVSSAFASVGVQGCAWGYRTGFRLPEGDRWLPGAVQAVATTH